ncbi:MAG: biotin--[acetyl-CoA-carboxylase] ligase [Deltaproteobacteria bacterium]|nr:biotin--[acetyl-CoA-carboxylase] ligase [Deltaproteobacteria bacterium]
MRGRSETSPAQAETNPYQAIASRTPGRIGWDIRYFDEVDSTQRVAAELAENGASHGTVVIAERQSAGRGRLGRAWHSPAGVNLYMTVILRPNMPLAEVPQLSLVAGVAAAEALETVAPGLVALKWPNDIWLRKRKAGGIIAQAVTDTKQGLLCVLLGIGLNLNLASNDIPPELIGKATSVLVATGRKCDRVQFAATLFNLFGLHYTAAEAGGFSAVRHIYERYFALNDRRVTVIDGDMTITGVVRGIGADGALILETRGGPIRILTGDVSLEGAYD